MQKQENQQTPKVGIDDMAAYLPQLYLPIKTLAEARELEYVKLNKGLGLEAMSIPDVAEDAASMAANAVVQLIDQNNLDPRQIGRLYLGTESGLDGSKPLATYVTDMLTDYYASRYGADCFLNCDVVDLTFACIGAVDALQNTADWVRLNPDRTGIVVGSDFAKYDLGSGGEYTQGAGATALLIRQSPRLLALGDAWGTATRGVHDFFKPQRPFDKVELIKEVLDLAGIQNVEPEKMLEALNGAFEEKGVLDSNDEQLFLHKDTPVFDGPYSNDCYRERIGEALAHFAKNRGTANTESFIDDWARLIFHLPYAYQARRMFSEIFMQEARKRGDWAAIAENIQEELPRPEAFDDERAYHKAYGKYLRAVSKTPEYRQFVEEKIEKGERVSSLVGNLYTSSIFLSLMSSLEGDFASGRELRGQPIGFFAYGSGSKSKVFEGAVQPQWREIVSRFHLHDTLEQRQAIDYDTYEQLHRGRLTEPVAKQYRGFRLAKVRGAEEPLPGARVYVWEEVGVGERKVSV